MKTSEFANLLRKIIREEVRSIVREEIKPLLTERVTAPTQRRTTAPTQTKQRYIPTIGGTIGNILRETAISMDSTPSLEQVWMEEDTIVESKPTLIKETNTRSRVASNDPMAALMKDYSAVLQSSINHSNGTHD